MLTPTIKLIHGDVWRMECLRVVETLGLPDWYIAAGFLRNAIWDVLHAKPARTPLNDVDVIYHDQTTATRPLRRRSKPCCMLAAPG